jgi:hypothetical protein
VRGRVFAEFSKTILDPSQPFLKGVQPVCRLLKPALSMTARSATAKVSGGVGPVTGCHPVENLSRPARCGNRVAWHHDSPGFRKSLGLAEGLDEIPGSGPESPTYERRRAMAVTDLADLAAATAAGYKEVVLDRGSGAWPRASGRLVPAPAFMRRRSRS